MENRTIKLHSAWGTAPERENRVLLFPGTPRPAIRSMQRDGRTLHLGEIAPGSTMTAFHDATRLAKALALAGNYGQAQGQLALAYQLQGQIPPDAAGNPYGQDEINYVLDVLAGTNATAQVSDDSSARASAAAGGALLSAGIQAAKPDACTGVLCNLRGSDVTVSGKGLVESFTSLSTPVKVGAAVAVALAIRALLR